ncbi:hypothetical protein CCR75_000850 [Bremia lactucae]|uniref:AAA+ ATPase domain-containing protein n=1 Tax=Bremia lactucae TaxID=4779 RepID=A0A976FP79_BRELC|nr:hypothetical protein CCR75_000850 [Bremia lactucae]
MTRHDCEQHTTLQWVKLRSMSFFWPACVYKSYSAAVAHAHDVWTLRNAKPVLDTEDCVLYFFGVGPRACHVVAPGASPSLQLCVVHEEDLTLASWTAPDDFTRLCKNLNIPMAMITRAQNNVCFIRACNEASKYANDVHTNEQAAALFVTFLSMAKTAHTIDKAIVEQETLPLSTTMHLKASQNVPPSTVKHTTTTTNVLPLLKTPDKTTLVATCWSQMLQNGWETMTQGDGQVLYKMPNTRFVAFKPNVNLFDSLEKACVHYIRDWIQQTRLNSSTEASSDFIALFWSMAAASGWESMETTTETLYKHANLPFDQWVPNVTIFCSKTHAVVKFLEESGFVTSCDELTANTIEKCLITHLKRKELDLELENEELQVEKRETKGLDEEASEDEDICESTEVVATVAGTSVIQDITTKKDSPLKACKTTSKSFKTMNSIAMIPVFKMAFGKLECELKRRGWYWKSGGLQWKYYQPYCKTKDPKTLEPNVDYFCGRENLETYLDRSGEYEHIRAKLEEAHRRQYIVESESEDENDLVVNERSSLYGPHSLNETTFSLKHRPNRSTSIDPSKRPRSKSSGFSSQTTLAEVKFGEIWRVLSDDGWHYRYGKLECDYFKPHCASTNEGIPGHDYFRTKDQLIEYLHGSGLWEETAARVRAEAAMSSSDGEISENDDEETSCSRKRKHKELTPGLSDKTKRKSLDWTPMEKVMTFTDCQSEEKDMGTMSPPTVETNENEHHGRNRQPLRNLANSFTPSPIPKESNLDCLKNAVTEKERTNETLLSTLVQDAMKKLTSAYIPLHFRYRENEFHEIKTFFTSCFQEKNRTSLYISGAPGCGKTALLKATQLEINQLYQECCPTQANELIRCHINAMTLTNSSGLFRQLANIMISKSFGSEEEAFKAIERATSRHLKTSTTMILILDEIDMLLQHNQIEKDLCRLFELAHRRSNRFLLVGISNQVDFTERYLPMLQQRLPDCVPHVVIFKPYTHQTIELILIDRLGGQALASKMVSLHGISFLARKIASTSGDIRLAVDTCRRVLQHHFNQTNQANAENPIDENVVERPLPLTDMLRIIKHALESKSALVIPSLPRNLQMILFASMRRLIVRSNQTESETIPLVTVEDLYLCYCDVSKDVGVLKPLSEREFKTALMTLSEEGLVAVAELRKHLVKVLFSTNDLLQSFRKDPFFSRLV